MGVTCQRAAAEVIARSSAMIRSFGKGRNPDSSPASGLSAGERLTCILIADDHDVVRSGVRSILEGHEGWEVSASLGTARGPSTRLR